MNKLKQLSILKRALCALAFAFPMLLMAQPIVQQSLPVKPSETLAEEDQITEMLDSLVKIRFISRFDEDNSNKALGKSNTFDQYSKSKFKQGEVPSYSVDIVKQRLKRMQSPIPFELTPQVKHYIDLYAMKRRQHTAIMLGLSKLYFPIFEQLLDKYDLPIELKYLAVVESALNPIAVSHAGATGPWQFMYGTAQLYNLEMNYYVDERRDVYKATVAACQYFKDMYALYHDWLLVIASYNCGPTNINKAIARSGGKTNFWQIAKYLPAETRGYVPAFMAVSYMMNYAYEHNINAIPTTLSYYQLDSITITRAVSLERVAQTIDVSAEMLQYLNPIYKKGIIPASDFKPYSLILPMNKVNAYIANADRIYRESGNYMPNIPVTSVGLNGKGNRLNEIAEDNAVSNSQQGREIQVIKAKKGEDIQQLAKKYECSIPELRKLNRLHVNKLKAGQEVKIYVQKTKNNLKIITAMNTAAPRDTTSTQNKVVFVYHIVQRGDTLWNIARRYQGVTVEQIKEYNKINSSRELKPGTRIKIAVTEA